MTPPGSPFGSMIRGARRTTFRKPGLPGTVATWASFPPRARPASSGCYPACRGCIRSVLERKADWAILQGAASSFLVLQLLSALASVDWLGGWRARRPGVGGAAGYLLAGRIGRPLRFAPGSRTDTVALRETAIDWDYVWEELFDYPLILLRGFIAVFCLALRSRNRREQLFIRVGMFTTAPAAVGLVPDVYSSV